MQTFDEWWQSTNLGINCIPETVAMCAWHAGRQFHEVKLAALEVKLSQLEGIDIACDVASEHVLLLQADVDSLQAKLDALNTEFREALSTRDREIASLYRERDGLQAKLDGGTDGQ